LVHRQSLGATSWHCPIIGKNIQASRHHWAQYPRIAPPVFGRNIKASHRHWAQYPSIAPPAIGGDFKASHKPLGMISKHRAAIWREIEALRRLIYVAGKPASNVILCGRIAVVGILP
jgi:hypothetical protein